MDQETKKEFEDLTQIIAESFNQIEEKMATKEDLKILENKMDEGFSSLRSELREIKDQVAGLEERLSRLFKTETEDVSAFYKDVEEIKARLLKLEQQMQIGSA